MLPYSLRRTVITIGVLAVFVCFPSVSIGQTDTAGVQSADISGQLTESGQLEVTETIRYDLGSRQTAGFARQLRIPAGGEITINSVRRDGLSEEYRTARAGQSLRVITGSQDIAISGEHRYTFNYTVDGVLQFGDGQPQAVWPVIRGGDSVAENITITLTAPGAIETAFCQIGSQSGCPVDRTADGISAAIDELPVNQPVTVRADVTAEALSVSGVSQSEFSWWYVWLALLLTVVASGSFGLYHYFAGISDQETDPAPERINLLER